MKYNFTQKLPCYFCECEMKWNIIFELIFHFYFKSFKQWSRSGRILKSIQNARVKQLLAPFLLMLLLTINKMARQYLISLKMLSLPNMRSITMTICGIRKESQHRTSWDRIAFLHPEFRRQWQTYNTRESRQRRTR